MEHKFRNASGQWKFRPVASFFRGTEPEVSTCRTEGSLRLRSSPCSARDKLSPLFVTSICCFFETSAQAHICDVCIFAQVCFVNHLPVLMRDLIGHTEYPKTPISRAGCHGLHLSETEQLRHRAEPGGTAPPAPGAWEKEFEIQLGRFGELRVLTELRLQVSSVASKIMEETICIQ